MGHAGHGQVDEFRNGIFVQPIVLGRFTDHLKLRVQFSDVDASFVIGLALENGFLYEIAILSNQSVMEMFCVVEPQTYLPGNSEMVLLILVENSEYLTE
jgi:hypothetical protein